MDFSPTCRTTFFQRTGTRGRTAGYYGLILISDYVIEDIINLIVERMVGVARINYIHVRRRSDSRGLFVHVELVLYYGVRVFEVSRILQSKIKRKVERMTGMQVQKVNISIRSLEVRSSAEDGSALAK